MKFFKSKLNRKSSISEYLLFALGEVVLIITGILIALIINDWNAERTYHKRIDNNIIRVCEELEGNIDECKEIISQLRVKDSLIHLVMTDLIQEKDYQNNLDLAYLILSFHNTSIEEKAYQNLIELNNSENLYHEKLINKLKDVYKLQEFIDEDNKAMHKYVYEETIPLVMNNTKSFGDLSYKLKVQPDIINFFTTSDLYKSYVSQYSILAISNQLRKNQLFFKNAMDIYFEIAEYYHLNNKYKLQDSAEIVEYEGQYLSPNTQDSLGIEVDYESVYLVVAVDFKLRLIPIKKDQYFIDHDTGGFFVTFYRDENKKVSSMSVNLSANRDLYKKSI